MPAKNKTKRKSARRSKSAKPRKAGRSKLSANSPAKTKRVTSRTKKTTRAARSVAKRAAPVRYVPGGPGDNLEKIDHIVVLMLENRSFDHMLGYLKLEGTSPDVDGLDSSMSNPDKDGNPHPVHRLGTTLFEHDPGHQEEEVAQQLSDNNGGFVKNYQKLHAEDDPNLIMGYHNGSALPVFDHLARNFCICDRWFCSVPGATWPNRLYAATAKATSKSNKKIPLYNQPSFVRHLESHNVSWAWYAHDMATLRLMDSRYSVGYGSHFFWFDRRTWVNPVTFLDHAAEGNLPAVSWIDPNFVDYSVTGPRESNDDHPPSDVMAGQDLVFKVYNAVINSPNWPKTLLVIVYDEHGGFYDHVVPENVADDNPRFNQYGVRVPAIIVSPWVERGKVSHKVFDHTSIIKTILRRFCAKADGSIPDMGRRVTNAEQLGTLLTLTTARDPTPFDAYQHLVDRIAQWRVEGFKKRTRSQARGRAPVVKEVTEFQEGIEKARKVLRKRGLPEGQP